MRFRLPSWVSRAPNPSAKPKMLPRWMAEACAGAASITAVVHNCGGRYPDDELRVYLLEHARALVEKLTPRSDVLIVGNVLKFDSRKHR